MKITFHIALVDAESPALAPVWSHVNYLFAVIERVRHGILFDRTRHHIDETTSREMENTSSSLFSLVTSNPRSVILLGRGPLSQLLESRIHAYQGQSTLVLRNSIIIMPEAAGDKESGWSLELLGTIVALLKDRFGLYAEASSLEHALDKTMDPVSYAGSNMRPGLTGCTVSDEQFIERVAEHLEHYLESANSLDIRASCTPSIALTSQYPARPMGVIEKILTHWAIGLDSPEVRPGQMICVSVDWVLTSELLWGGMEKTYNQMNRPRPHRNDRIWLAVDHTVDPRTTHLPKQKELVRRSEKFRDEAKIINYLPANTSIMHTDFTREKAQAGTIVVGSDSHTCSAGSMGAFALGLGAADVVMPLVTGETWLRVPEVCRINFVGSLPHGITGKDVIMYILGLFKRNTIAFQRAVEYGGSSLHQLSMDARFAIANMTTEFGGMGACSEADSITAKWINSRRKLDDRDGALYFTSDSKVTYAEVRTIDLSKVEVTTALYPNPDDVVVISSKSGMKLDGCFIGACTTTEEELVLAALVLEAGLRMGLRPLVQGKRRVTPGSLIIIHRLHRDGLLEVYKEAGFEVGAPGCSYCVGINDVDVAGPGEVWLSSQNRNFRNRMGKGSIGNITCAAAVAASSFRMQVTDPRELLGLIDIRRFRTLLGDMTEVVEYDYPIQEPRPRLFTQLSDHAEPCSATSFQSPARSLRIVTSRIQRFGDNVDTDAIVPAEFMPGKDDSDLGRHCFEYFRPEFRDKVAAGAKIIVAAHGFGSGSSREDAVRALRGAGVECVIAKSFAFIYERNQLNMGLYSIVILDEEFYRLAVEGRVVTIDKIRRTLIFEDSDLVFSFSHTTIEKRLLQAGGVLPLYNLHGKSIFRQIIKPSQPEILPRAIVTETIASFTNGHQDKKSQLAW